MKKPRNVEIGKKAHKWEELTDQRIRAFFIRAQKYLIYGCPSEDTKGHGVPVSIRLSKDYIHMIAEVEAIAPKEWYKNKSDMHRALLMVGSFVALQIFKKNIPKELNALQHLEGIEKWMHKLYLLSVRDSHESIDREIMRIEESLTTASSEDHAFIKDMGADFDTMKKEEFVENKDGSAW